MDYLVVAKVLDPDYDGAYRYYYAYINGSDGSVITSGDFVSPESGEEYNIFDDVYFTIDDNLFYRLFQDDNDGTEKKLPIMVAYVGIDELSQVCGGQA